MTGATIGPATPIFPPPMDVEEWEPPSVDYPGMSWPPTFDGLDADRELARLGLGPDAQDRFTEVLRAGHVDAGQATNHSAPSDAGSRQWYRMVQVLRERLHVELAWESIEAGGCSLSRRPDGLLAIQVASGTHAVALPGPGPSFANPKGLHTARAADGNQMVMPDPGTGRTLATVPKHEDTPRPWATWFLLYYVDRSRLRREVRAELSLLSTLGAGGQTCEWDRRIVLRPLPYTDEPSIEMPPDIMGDTDIRRWA